MYRRVSLILCEVRNNTVGIEEFNLLILCEVRNNVDVPKSFTDSL